MYALIALGYTLVYGVLQLINFAHSEVFMSGAFGSYLVVHLIVGDGSGTATWEVPFVIVIGMVTGAITAAGIAWTLERVAYRPLRRTRRAEARLLDQRDRRIILLVDPGQQAVQQPDHESVPDLLRPQHDAVHDRRREREGPPGLSSCCPPWR